MTKSLSPKPCRILRIAEIVSHLTSAMIFALIVILITSFKDSTSCFLVGLLTATIFLSLIPTISILIMVVRGTTDIFVSRLEYRRPLLVLACLSHLAGTVVLSNLGFTDLAHLCFTYFTVTLSVLIVSLKWKISIHMAGVAGPTTFLALKYGSEYFLLLLLLPLVAWARIKMRAHTVSQLLAGAILAIVITASTLLFIV